MGGGGKHQSLYRLNEFDAASLGQIASQITSMVPDASMIAPMMATAAGGMLSNYASNKIGKLNPMDKIETAVHRTLDNTRAGQWLNDKLDRASNFMDKKLGNTQEPALTPAMRMAIGAEVNSQLNARGIGRGNRNSSPPPSTSSPPPSTSSTRPPASSSTSART